MAAKYLDRFPQNYVKELQIIVHELNQAVLQNKPNDILHFIAHYFNDLNKVLFDNLFKTEKINLLKYFLIFLKNCFSFRKYHSLMILPRSLSKKK